MLDTLVARTRTGRLSHWLRRAGFVSSGLIVALFAFGVVTMGTMLLWWPVALAVPVLALVPIGLERLPRSWRPAHTFALTVVTVVVSLMALLGIDVIWASIGLPRPGPVYGLVIAGFVMGPVAYGYLRWVGKEPPRNVAGWALFAAIAGLALRFAMSGEAPSLELVAVATCVGIAAWLYLRQSAGPDVKHPLWWALLVVAVLVVVAPLLVEAIQGGRTNVALLLGGAVIAIFMGLNGLWLPDQSERRRLARKAAGRTLVLVAVPLVVDVFLHVTSTAPAAPADKPVPAAVKKPPPLPRAAVDHSPVLLFDSGERFRTPLDVDSMFATRKVELCPEGHGLLADCLKVSRATDLRIDFGNLRFNTQELEDAVKADRVPTTIYAHAVEDQLHRGWTDIDYWWYLPDNPADTGEGAMCGAGFVIPEITCFDHQSDWEGATVVVDAKQQPVAVHFAAHNHVVAVPWPALHVTDHPKVFVARGTHAGYPLPCASSSCGTGSVLQDNSHDGSHRWPEDPCSTRDCVKAFPETTAHVPATWNAFDGHWGSAVCVKDLYCARSAAPKAPGVPKTQPRFKRPWCYDFEVTTDLHHPNPVKVC
jgi:hypothetical protein